MAAALDGLRSAGVPLRSNVKFVFEGEEEQGSPHLEEILARNKELLRGDVWLISDGPIHPSRQQQIVFGARLAAMGRPQKAGALEGRPGR
jgi:acetylornithine deacetylase/succinyl-diaminopimelate desuccinylase-like protein